MKYFPLIFILFLLTNCRTKKSAGVVTDNSPINCSAVDTLILEGNFTNRNLFVINPEVNCSDPNSGLFTTKKVIVNDSINMKPEALNGSSYEIPLMSMNFKTGDKLVIRIIYVKGVQPKVLKPEVH